uniref:Envelope glycoprotein n=1 Tax=Strix occidentalis caurina TaxID=311401 RepID=A0A8D0FNG3_STROC
MKNLAAPSEGVGKGGRGAKRRWGIRNPKLSGKRPHNPGLRVIPTPTRNVTNEKHHTLLKTHHQGITLSPPTLLRYVIVFWFCYPVHTAASNVHQPHKWSLIQMEASQLVNSTITAGSPSFKVHLSSLIRAGEGDTWKWQAQYKAFYICPASNPGKGYCNYPGHYYCAYWGCETWASDWTGSGEAYLVVGWGPPGCKKPQPHHYGCGDEDGVPWSSCNIEGWCSYIYLNVSKNKEKTKKGSKSRTTTLPSVIQVEPILTPETNPLLDPLWKIVQASLHLTHPELTTHCWLCYDVQPPYYEAIGTRTPFNRSNEGITMQHVKGTGTCIGTVPKRKRKLCKNTLVAPNSIQGKWLIPSPGARWICSKTGLTPCITLDVFDSSSEYCVQVIVLPRVLYHRENDVFEQVEKIGHRIVKREPLSAITIATLLGIGAAGAGTGIASLVQQQQGLHSLRVAVDEDLERIEKSISGNGLLFFQQGGLCVALGEECCVYADHTGVVRDTMTKLREGLEKRRREREQQQSWYESWFTHSPWLNTLLSTIAGPLILLIIGLTFGPCIMNKVIAIVKGKLEAAHLLLVGQQYQPVENQEDAPVLKGRLRPP